MPALPVRSSLFPPLPAKTPFFPPFRNVSGMIRPLTSGVRETPMPAGRRRDNTGTLPSERGKQLAGPAAYATFGGLLTGFAFSGLSFYITRKHEQETAPDEKHDQPKIKGIAAPVPSDGLAWNMHIPVRKPWSSSKLQLGCSRHGASVLWDCFRAVRAVTVLRRHIDDPGEPA